MAVIAPLRLPHASRRRLLVVVVATLIAFVLGVTVLRAMTGTHPPCPRFEYPWMGVRFFVGWLGAHAGDIARCTL